MTTPAGGGERQVMRDATRRAVDFGRSRLQYRRRLPGFDVVSGETTVPVTGVKAVEAKITTTSMPQLY